MRPASPRNIRNVVNMMFNMLGVNLIKDGNNEISLLLVSVDRSILGMNINEESRPRVGDCARYKGLQEQPRTRTAMLLWNHGEVAI